MSANTGKIYITHCSAKKDAALKYGDKLPDRAFGSPIQVNATVPR